MPPRLLHSGGHTARIRPWPGEPSTAQLLTLDHHASPHISVLRSWLGELSRLGYTKVRTGAVSVLRVSPYESLRFAVVQELSLLHLELSQKRELLRAETPLRKPRPGEFFDLAKVDRRAFPERWGLDAAGIEEAAMATPRHRLRVASAGRSSAAVGYAVTGRAGRLAFLQRLAVDPEAQGQGIGGTLVLDSVHWARRWRCTTMAVNTQKENEPALGLYHRAGFVAHPHGLVVLERTLDGAT